MKQVSRDLSPHGLTRFENVKDRAQTRLAITRSLILMTRSQQPFFSLSLSLSLSSPSRDEKEALIYRAGRMKTLCKLSGKWPSVFTFEDVKYCQRGVVNLLPINPYRFTSRFAGSRENGNPESLRRNESR